MSTPLTDKIDDLRAELAAYKKESAIRGHQVLTCGVAASSLDPHLTLTGAYWDKWNSVQADAVRALRADRDDLRQKLEVALSKERIAKEAAIRLDGKAIQERDAAFVVPADFITSAMLQAGRDEYITCGEQDMSVQVKCARIYRAMLAAQDSDTECHSTRQQEGTSHDQ